MKLILTGATGYVGTEILEQCIAHNYVERIYCLTRKPLDPKYFTKAGRGKVVEILHDDFTSYPPSLLTRLRDEGQVEGCIWALGPRYESVLKDKAAAEESGIVYPKAAAEAFAKELATALTPQDMPKRKFPFRFVFISAWGAEQDLNRGLWMWNDWRKLKGAAEKALLAVVDESELVQGLKCFEVICLRPGGVIGGGDAIGTILWEATVPSIAVDRLAKCAIRTVMMGTGDEDKRILENKDCLGDDWAYVNTLTL